MKMVGVILNHTKYIYIYIYILYLKVKTIVYKFYVIKFTATTVYNINPPWKCTDVYMVTCLNIRRIK